jgi:uncharacterized membrane protein (DUF2068 family)
MTLSPAAVSGLRLVALFEAVKGAIVLGAGFGLLALLHRDVRQIAESLVTRLHLDPERHLAGLFLDAAARVTDTRLWMLAALAVLYSAVRVTEAYGLWFERRWAAWLGAASGGVYVPIEIYELLDKPSWIKAGTLALNVGVVLYLLWTLRRSVLLQRAVAVPP